MKKTVTFITLCLLALQVYATETWTVKAPMPSARMGAGVVSVDSCIYVVGGSDSLGNMTTTVFAYNVYTNTWTTKASMATARASSLTVAVNSKIYVIGGFTGTAAINVVEEFNVATNTWTTKSPMPTSRSQFSGAVIGNKIYCSGGWLGSYTNLEEYNVSTDTWVTKTPMNHGKLQEGGGVALGNKFYFLGGKNYGNTEFYDSSVVYNPATDSWAVGTNMPFPRYAGASVYVKGRIYYMCGADGGHTLPNFRSNFYFDSATNSWHNALPCLYKRTYCGAAVGKNKRIYLIGGVDSTGTVVYNLNHEYYNDTLVSVSLGVAENIVSEAVGIFPNPCVNMFSVQLPHGVGQIATVYILNMAGQLAAMPGTISSGDPNVDVSQLPRGIYMVITATSSKQYTNTLVVN